MAYGQNCKQSWTSNQLRKKKNRRRINTKMTTFLIDNLLKIGNLVDLSALIFLIFETNRYGVAILIDRSIFTTPPFSALPET